MLRSWVVRATGDRLRLRSLSAFWSRHLGLLVASRARGLREARSAGTMPARQRGYHARKGLEERCEAVVRQQDEDRYHTQGWIAQWKKATETRPVSR